MSESVSIFSLLFIFNVLQIIPLKHKNPCYRFEFPVRIFIETY